MRDAVKASIDADILFSGYTGRVKGHTHPFSVVIPIRDTPRERAFATKSLPALNALNPNEILIGVDEPADHTFLTHLKSLCDCRIIRIPHNPEYKFQLAHITMVLYKECRNDIILTTTVDNVLCPSVVGESPQGITTCLIKSCTRGIGGLIRRWNARRVRKRGGVVGTGVYWIDRRYTTLPDTRHIHNGIDTIIQEYNEVRTMRGVVGYALDVENPDYPWRQFGLGVWIYANRRDLSPHRRWRGYVARKLPFLYALKVGVTHAYPWVVRGVWWAARHPEHEVVRAVRGLTYIESTYLGSVYIGKIRDWDAHGTGFDW